MYNPSEENASTKKEIEIRGRYAMMACDIEFALLNIIMFSNPDPHNHERIGEFKGMRMAGKINNAICDIKKYKLAYYNEFKDEFDGLEEFRIVRNDITHCVGRFTDSTLSTFRINFIEPDENDNERMMYKDYTAQYIENSLNKFAKMNAKLFILWMRLKAEFDGKPHPFVHPSTGND